MSLDAPGLPALDVAQDEGLLRELWRILLDRRRMIAAVVLSALAAATVRSLLTQPVYQGTARILIERENPVLEFRDVAQEAGGDDYYQTQYRLLQSRSLARNVVVGGDLLREPEFGGPLGDAERAKVAAAKPGESAAMESAIDRLLARLHVSPDKTSRLVDIAFESSRPDIAAGVPNAIAGLYIEQTLDLRHATSADAGRWLGSQIQEQRHNVEAAAEALQALKEREGIVNIEERRALLEQRMKDLGSAATRLKTQRLEKEALAAQMRQTRSPEDLPEVMRNPIVQTLTIELATLGRKEAQLGQRYLDQHPEVVQVRKQIAETRARLEAEAQRLVQGAETEYRTAASQETSVLAALEGAKTESEDLSRRSLQYDSKKRELDAAKTVLDTLLARAKETDVTRQLRASNIRIVDPAVVPRTPVRPRLLHDLALGIIFGLGLAVGLALLLDNLDNTLKTPDDVRRHLRSPLLALVPESAIQGGVHDLNLVRSATHGPFAESYRLLRTALLYSWPERGSRIVAVTSTVPGEGKTLTSLNLALSLASAEGADRVLLVDADLRRAGIHGALDLPRSPGLTDVLVGTCATEEAIKPVVGTGLHVLPAGTKAPSPADLLTGAGMKRLVDELRARYTWIVVDTPPVAAVADPLVLAPLTDGVLMVAGTEMVARTAAREAMRQVTATGARVLGVVLNRVRFERHSYYYGVYHRARGEYHARA